MFTRPFGINNPQPYYAYRIDISRASGNLSLAQVEFIGLEAEPLRIIGPDTHTFGTDYIITSAGGAGLGEVSYEIISEGTTGAGFIIGNRLTVTQAGVFNIKAVKAGDGLWAQQESGEFSLTVSGLGQEIVINSPLVHRIGTDYILSVSGARGSGAVTYRITGGTGEGDIDGDTLTVTKAGTIVIIAEIAADGRFAGTTSAPFTLTVVAGVGGSATPAVAGPLAEPLPQANRSSSGGIGAGPALSFGIMAFSLLFVLKSLKT